MSGRLQDGQSESLRRASLTAGLGPEATSADILAAAQADYGRLVTVLYGEGYYGPQVSIRLDGREAAQIDPVSPPARVGRVEISVDPGPLFIFGTTNMGPIAEGTEIPSEFAPGQVARVTVLQEAAEAGVAGWRAQGHAKAAVGAQRITADHRRRQLNATIPLEPGPRLRFGTLQIAKPSAVRSSRIQAIAGLPTGEVFSPEDVRRATTRLRRTGAFSSVILREADAPNADGTLDFTAQLADQTPRRFGLGGEFASLDGISLSTFWMHRNFTGRADRLRFDAEISEIGGTSGGMNYSIAGRYTRPASFGADTDFFVEGEIARKNEENFDEDLVRFEVGFLRYLTDEIELSAGLGVQAARTNDAFGAREYTVFSLGLQGIMDFRDDPRDATEGTYLKARVVPFAGIGTMDGGLSLSADARAYRTFGLGERPLTLAVRGQLGSLFGPGLVRAPSDFLYFSGGGGTVRGHSYQSLAVDLGGGLEVGGRSFLGLSTEARMPVFGDFGAVAFFDAGYIGRETFPNGQDGEWHSGAGVGLRYATGIGPIRFDVALPVTGPADETGVQIYVGIGQAF